MDADEIDNAKRRFAAELLKDPREPFKIALAIGLDTGAALRASAEWPRDPVVLAEQEKLLSEKENGELDFLPTKADAARLAWEMANSGVFFEDRLKALKLYSDIRGYIAKPEAVKIDNSVTHNRVMVVKEHANDEDWERKMREQQANLTKEASGNAATKH